MNHLVTRAACALIVVGTAASAHAQTPVERGAYLMRSVVACDNCHTPIDAKGPIKGKEFAGGFKFDEGVFVAVAPNITPDKETGIGNWTDAQIIAAIREGVRPDGTIIGPPMPIEFYRDISDSDVKALVAYLRTVKPVKNKVEKSVYKIPLPPSYGPAVTKVKDVPRADKVAYGAYIAGPLAHCLECHTPRRQDGGPDMTRAGAGGLEIHMPDGIVVSRNITPDKDTGIGKWTDAQIVAAITKGVRPDGTKLAPPMPYAHYAKTSRADMAAIIAFLRSMKPINVPPG